MHRIFEKIAVWNSEMRKNAASLKLVGAIPKQGLQGIASSGSNIAKPPVGAIVKTPVAAKGPKLPVTKKNSGVAMAPQKSKMI